MRFEMTVHPIPPIYDRGSKVLILGSFPSVASREVGFFYGHPQNRFWRVLSELVGEDIPTCVEEKINLLISHGIALWDVIESCEIVGSADNTIRDVTPNDLSRILDAADVRAIFVNGKTALKYYDKYIKPTLGREAVCLPSTSPANAAFSVAKLVGAWQIIKAYL
jgi:hypoxanthine-DNA glycosylase